MLTRTTKKEEKQREERQKKMQFLISNTYCKIISKRKELHIFTKNDKYFLTVQGLDTKEEREVLVSASTYKDCHHLIQFARNKAAMPFEIFKEKNKKQGAIVLEKYSSKEDNLFLMKLYGIDSDTSEIYEFSEEIFNKIPLKTHLDISENESEDGQNPGGMRESTWYNVIGYDTSDIEDMIKNAGYDAYLYAYYKDASLSNILHNFTISTKAPQNPGYYYIEHFDEVLHDFEQIEGWSREKKDQAYELLSKEFNISSKEEYNRKLVEQFLWGCIRIKIAALKKYPVQTRQTFCNMVNSIWGLSCYYSPGEDQGL